LNRAFADGQVKIVSTTLRRARTGTSDHAEYYAAGQKVILAQGEPVLVDSLKGRTRGRQLTWWANNDRLLVEGEANKPAQGTIRKK
jgi:lipopolysaccharide export system protein LptA